MLLLTCHLGAILMAFIKETDPLNTCLVFSCGMGAVRTTFAMVAASIVRRKQLIDLGMPDPYHIVKVPLSIPPSRNESGSGRNTVSQVIAKFCTLIPYQPPSEALIMMSLEQKNTQQDLSRSLLRLTYLLQTSSYPYLHRLITRILTNVS